MVTLEDKEKVDAFVFEQQKKQIKYAVSTTAGVLGVYWIFLSKKAFFMNMFNNRERMRIFNYGRKILGVYAIFLGSMIAMNSTFEKSIPNGIN